MTQKMSIELAFQCGSCSVVNVVQLPLLRLSRGEAPPAPAPVAAPVAAPAGFQKVGFLGETPAGTPLPAPQQPASTGTTIADLVSNIPAMLKAKIDILESQDYYKIQPKGFLGRQGFSTLNMVVRAFNGNYVSEGKTSHWLIPKWKGA